MPRGRGTARGRAAVAKGRCEGRRKRAPWHSGRVSARAAAATSRGSRSRVSRPPGRALWFPTAGAHALWGVSAPGSELTAARGGRAGPDGDSAALSLLPPAGLYKLGPRPPWSARLRASPDGQARPGTPRCPAQSARAPALRVKLVTVARGPRPARPRSPPTAQRSHSHNARGALLPRTPGPGSRGGRQYKMTPSDLNPLTPTP